MILRRALPSVGRAEISPEVAKLSRRRLLRNGLSLVVWRCSLVAIVRPIPGSTLRSGRCCASMIACSRRYIIRSCLPKPIRRARSPDRSASTLTIQFGRSARSQKIGALPSPGWLRTRPRGRSTDCAACRSRLRSPGTSVLKDGARSERCAAAPLSAPRRRGSAGALCRLHLL